MTNNITPPHPISILTPLCILLVLLLTSIHAEMQILPTPPIPLIPSPPSSQSPPDTPRLAPKPPVKRILAFGDSLTLGWCNQGHHFRPYAIEMEHLLNQNNATYIVKVSGIPGDQACSMSDRLATDLGVKWRYAHVVLLAGINDVFKRRPVKEIKACILWLVKLAKDYGARVHLIGVLPMRRGAENEAQRRQLNQELKDARVAQFIEFKDNEVIPLLQDGVHFKCEEYDRLGEMIYERVFSTTTKPLPYRKQQ